jgi:hypothetical protein
MYITHDCFIKKSHFDFMVASVKKYGQTAVLVFVWCIFVSASD